MSPDYPARRFGLRIPTIADMPEPKELVDLVRADLPRLRFRPDELWEETSESGGMRLTYVARRGENGKAVVKIDAVPKSPNGQRTFERGNNTLNEYLFLEERDLNHAPPSLSRNLHAGIVSQNERDFVYLVEQFYEGETLRSRLERGPMDRDEFINTFTPILEGINWYVTQEGILHRDPHPGNIILTPSAPVITDWANSRRIEDLVRHENPTNGKRSVADPLLFETFTEKPVEYGLGSEWWSWGVTMWKSLLGKAPYELDYEKGTLVDFRGKSLLDEDGKFVPEKWTDTEHAMKEMLPRELKDLAQFASTCTLPYSRGRITSLDRTVELWERITQPTKWYNHWLTRAAVTTVAIAGIAVSGYLGFQAHQVEQEKRAILESTEIVGNFIDDLEINSDIGANPELVNITDRTQTFHFARNEQIEPLYLNPGDNLRPSLRATQVERERDEDGYMSYLPMTLTIDGLVTDRGTWQPERSRRPSSDFGYMGSGRGGPRPAWVRIPEWARPGVYRANWDVFPYEEGERLPGNQANLRFTNPEGSILRRSQAIVVGDIPEEEQVVLMDAKLKPWDTAIELRSVVNRPLADDIVYTVRIPELEYEEEITDFKRSYASHTISPNIPDAPMAYPGIMPKTPAPTPSRVAIPGQAEQQERHEAEADSIANLPYEVNATLQIIASREGRVLHVAHLPITQTYRPAFKPNRYRPDGPPVQDGVDYHWELRVPTATDNYRSLSLGHRFQPNLPRN